MPLPECIKDYWRLRRPLVAWALTTLVAWEIAWIVTMILLWQNFNESLPIDMKQDLLNTNSDLFLSWTTTGVWAWIYYRMPKRLDNFITDKIEPILEKYIQKIIDKIL